MDELTLIVWWAWGAVCLIFGMVTMAIVRVERGDMDADSFDEWIDWEEDQHG